MHRIHSRPSTGLLSSICFRPSLGREGDRHDRRGASAVHRGKAASSLLAISTAAILASCGGGGGSGGGGNGGGGGNQLTPPTGVSVGYVPRGFTLTWAAAPSATRYEVLLDPDGPGPAPAAVAGTTAATTLTLTDIPLHASLNAVFTVRTCSAAQCGPASAAVAPDLTRAIGYVKASNTRANSYFGIGVALSGDGNTLAVGADGDSSGIAGDPADQSAPDAGAVHVYARVAGVWAHQAYLKASVARTLSYFGNDVALSHDGSTLAVGAVCESSAATGINGDDTNSTAPCAGAAYVFVRQAGTWSQQAYVKASNTQADDYFGDEVALSADGSTLAVGATGEDSAATGVNNGNQNDESAQSAGAAYVFVRAGTTWSQQAYVKASNTRTQNGFGRSVGLSGDGNLLAVGSDNERSNATGVNGDQGNTLAPFAGAVYVFARSSGTWSQQAYLKQSTTRAQSLFGTSVAVSGDGSTIAVGAIGESSNSTGIDGNQGNMSAPQAGAVYVFRRSANAWQQEAYVKASNTAGFASFGTSVALSADGNRLVAGAIGENSNAKGIGGDQADASMFYAGATYAFTRSATGWAQQAYLKASNTHALQTFGSAVAVAADGNQIAVGAVQEGGAATGIGGDQTNLTASIAGAVYLY